MGTASRSEQPPATRGDAAARRARVLIVGAGGLGLPAARALVEAGVGALRLVDDDTVDLSNLHRQVLYGDADVGTPKVEAAARRLESMAGPLAAASERARPGTTIEAVRTRFLPDNAAGLLRDVDLVVEGSDNHASKFLVADACALAGVSVVHAGAIRWGGWVLSVANAPTPASEHEPHRACLRCVFEDVPRGPVATCATAGVVGPVVGLLGALQARLALALLRGSANGVLVQYDGLRGRLRHHRVHARATCPHGRRAILDLDMERYRSGCTV